MPGRFSSQYSPVNATSVASCWVTRYCRSSRRARSSASVGFFQFSMDSFSQAVGSEVVDAEFAASSPSRAASPPAWLQAGRRVSDRATTSRTWSRSKRAMARHSEGEEPRGIRRARTMRPAPSTGPTNGRRRRDVGSSPRRRSVLLVFDGSAARDSPGIGRRTHVECNAMAAARFRGLHRPGGPPPRGVYSSPGGERAPFARFPPFPRGRTGGCPYFRRRRLRPVLSEETTQVPLRRSSSRSRKPASRASSSRSPKLS